MGGNKRFNMFAFYRKYDPKLSRREKKESYS